MKLFPNKEEGKIRSKRKRKSTSPLVNKTPSNSIVGHLKRGNKRVP